MKSEEENKPNNLIIWIFVISILLLIVIVYMILIKSRAGTVERLNNNNVSVSSITNNSYMFASPVRAQAGADFIRVTIFVLDHLGNGLKNEKVTITTDENVDIKAIQELSDENGKTIFDLSSNTKGQYEIKAKVREIPINQILKITFD